MKIKTASLIQSTFLLLSSLIFLGTYGQTKKTSLEKIYLHVAGGASSHKGSFSEFGVQTVLKHNWTSTFSYHSIEMNPKNLPANYDPGYTVVFFIPLRNADPAIHMKLYSLSAGKFLKAGRNTWFTTEAGLSVVNGEKISFSPVSVNQSGNDPLFLLFGIAYTPPNYNTTVEKKTTIGGILRANFNWAFSSFAGLGAGVFANFNSIQSPVGFDIKLTCGWMNRKSKR